MSTCKTSIQVGNAFLVCGKPVEEIVRVGLHLCGYCAEHAASARRFVEQQGRAKLVDIQQRAPKD